MVIRRVRTKYSDQSLLTQPDKPAEEHTPFFSDTAEETFWHSKSGKIWVSFYVLLIVIALEIGIFMYVIGIVKRAPPSESDESSRGIFPSVTQTPATVDLGSYSITVLNGSGIAGRALAAKEFLEEEKLTVLSIGNATGSASNETSVYIKQNVPEELVTKIKNALAKRYILNDVVSYSDDGGADVTIIIGKGKVTGSQ